MSITAPAVNVRFKSLDPKFIAAYFEYWHDEVPPQMAPYRLWERIVEAYARCGLTKAEDKLVAISGIAKHMATMTNDEYVVGMWRRYLESELLWEVNNREHYSVAHRPSEYRAPSWSWASVDAVVRPGVPTENDLLIKVLDIDIQYVTDDKTGLVSGGFILLRCHVKRVEIFRKYHWLSFRINGVEGGTLIYLDEHESPFDPTLVEQSTLFCTAAHDRDNFPTILLFQAIDVEKGTYRRIGIARSLDAPFIGVVREWYPDEGMLPVVERVDAMDVIRVV